MGSKDKTTEDDFQNIHKKYFKKILSYIKYRVNDGEIAQELAQDVFLSVWQFMNGGDGKIKNNKKFLYTIARNKIIDHYRSRKFESSIDDIGDYYLAMEGRQDKDMDNNLNIGKIKKILRGMDDKYKKMITYRYLNQMSIEEICRATGKSPNHVSVLIHKGVKMLEKKFKQYGTA